MIFVTIAAYRDPELEPTIADCLAKAMHPEQLHFGICNQHGDERGLEQYRNDPRFRIDDVPAVESKGCCWSRARSQALYRGEHFVLQLDSHHRFEPNWDHTLCEMFHQTGAAKPIITAYAGSYDAETGLHPCVPWKMVTKPFAKDGVLLQVPARIPDYEKLTAPIPARFLSGHFMFTLGKWCEEVPYDPSLFFHGEEPSLAARSFTHGYDLFHPHRLVIHHQYHRKGRPKIWDDHKDWQTLDRHSKARFRQLMGMEPVTQDLTGFGFGTVRTLADYERFAGIDFKGRRLRAGCLDGTNPPTSEQDEWSTQRTVLLQWSAKSIELPEDCIHVEYFVDDKDGKGMWNHKATKADGFQAPTTAEFSSCREPAFLIVWPFTGKGPGPKKYSLPLDRQTVYVPR